MRTISPPTYIVILFVCFFVALSAFLVLGNRRSVAPKLPMQVDPVVPVPAEVTPTSYAEALELSRQTKRPLLVMFSMKTCPPCRAMKETTLQDEEIKTLLKKYVFFISLDDPQMANKFNIYAVPHFCVISEDEKIVRSVEGKQSVAEFKRFLNKSL